MDCTDCKYHDDCPYDPASCDFLNGKDAEISTLRAQLEEANKQKRIAFQDYNDLCEVVGERDAELERLKNCECGKCHRSLAPDGDCHGCRADRLEMEIERLEKRVRGDDRAMLQYEDALEEYCAEMRAVQSRARAWKRCAKRWRGIIRMWPKGLVSAPELEIKLETLSELNPRPESKSEPE